MTLKVEHNALDDVESAYQFFANRSFDYADHFRECLRDDLSQLQTLHGFHPEKFGFHYVFSNRFRTTIFYLILNQQISVVAILDQRFSEARTHSILKSRQKS